MTLNERIIAITEEVNDLLSKDSQIGSHDFIKLACRLINFSHLASNLENLE